MLRVGRFMGATYLGDFECVEHLNDVKQVHKLFLFIRLWLLQCRAKFGTAFCHVFSNFAERMAAAAASSPSRLAEELGLTAIC